ncbi:MAG: efflux RND transporter periplasmic adaptor subunit [Candidatus Thiodiazotropha sp. (ex Lucinoma borealis)]|nr:efflux RND transporter periplasmic adaptor subunit [Candidatus Thiodiazotropha sp. (ex Lucinoma borealis)]
MVRGMLQTLLISTVLLAGCDNQNQLNEIETIRPIKAITLSDPVSAVQLRRFTGLIQAKNVTELSFQSSGKVTEIRVDNGDQIKVGQTLALLDDETFRLNLNSAEADLKKSQAEYQKVNKDYLRKKELRKKGYVSASDLDQAVADKDSAQLSIKSARSKLAIAQKDLNNTVLKAPFDGYISSRTVNPHTEVSAGQTLFEIDATGKLEVELKIPENLIEQIDQGKAGTVYISNRDKEPLDGVITQVGTRAQEGNAFLVLFEIAEAPDWVYSGMSAEVAINVADGQMQDGFLLPASAILPDPNKQLHYVFVYDNVSGTVKKTPVILTGGQNQQALITSGLQKGDIVAVAGASFLSDGMKVRLPPIKH